DRAGRCGDELHRGRGRRRPPVRGACRCVCMRCQPHRGAGPVSPRAAGGWQPGRLPLGRGAQTRAARRAAARAAEARLVSAVALRRQMLELDWEAVESALHEDGFAVTPPVLAPAACKRLRARFDDEGTSFRSTVDMERYNYGRGRYRYFDYPLPDEV